MFKSSRKKLIAIGCSFTEHLLTSDMSPDIDHDFPRWPQHLADMLDMECVNLGKSGSGNDQILAKALDVMLREKDVGLVVLMWSEWQRIGFQRWKNWNIWHQVTPHETDQDHSFACASKLFDLQNPHHATRNALRTFIHAEKILRDVPYMFIQGTHGIFYYNVETLKTISCKEGTPYENMKFHLVNDSRHQSTKEMFACHDYFDYIENNVIGKFIGWPIMKELGGYCIADVIEEPDPSRTTLTISKDDTHPNAAGHKIIAELLYEQYKEIYNEH